MMTSDDSMAIAASRRLVACLTLSAVLGSQLARAQYCTNQGWIPSSFPDATVGTYYDVYFLLCCQMGATIYSVSAGQLPPGLSIVNNYGAAADLIGTPTLSGIYSFTI